MKQRWTKERILEFVPRDKYVSTQEVARAAKCSESTARKYLKELDEDFLVSSHDEFVGCFRIRWWTRRG